MDHFECYTFEEAIHHETSFTRSKPQEYYILIDNILRVGDLISNSKLGLKMGPKQTAQIADPLQGVRASLKF